MLRYVVVGLVCVKSPFFELPSRITAIFTALVIAVIGFAYWDRRTIIKKAKEEIISEIEKEGKLS
ncbi:MAG: hypothetical protein ACK4MW_01650 [Aquificaceae bacterium]